MSGRSEDRFREVVLARYNYRHEAEFAAGFLREAGIPYRLQIDDPTLGLSATNAATLLVIAGDERRARRVLDEDFAETGDDPHSWADESTWLAEAEMDPATVAAREALPSVHSRKSQSDLSLRARLIAAASGLGVASTLGLEAVRAASDAIGLGLALVAALLVGCGLFGRAPEPIRGLLSALSGDAP